MVNRRIQSKKVWYKAGISGEWRYEITGTLKHASVSADGEGISGEWRYEITGTLKHASVSADGEHVWEVKVSHKEDVWYRTETGLKGGNWKKIGGSKKLMQLCVSAKPMVTMPGECSGLRP
eukprot:923409_1